MANYRYKISFTYMHKVSKTKYDEYNFDNMNVLGCIVHSDFNNNNMPIIIMDISIESKIANILVDTANIQNDYIILNINKFNIDDEMEIELPYISGIFNYYTFEQINKHASLDYNEEINANNPNNLTRQLKIGLIKNNNILSNAISLNGIITNKTTMQDVVQYCFEKTGMPTLVEQFDYNTILNQAILPPLNSLSKILRYLNSISVFYKTQYRFFIDFDTIYLISSSGNAIPQKGETIHSILFDIGDVGDRESKIEGMYTIKQQGLYYIPITFNDCQLADNYITSQQYSSIAAITNSDYTNSKLNLRSGDNSVNLTKTIRINNDNTHMIENISSSIANSNTNVSIYKVGVDNSIFTPNKEYSIKYSNTYDETHNGNYLLNSKQEVFTRDGNRFASSVMLSLAKIGS